MKKNYLLLLWMLFMASYLSAQSTTETFESSPVNVANFTSGGKTFSLSSSAIDFTVVQLQYYGYNQSDRFIQVKDLGGGLPGTYGQSGTISTTGSFKLNNLWVYLTGDSANQNPNQTLNGQPGTVTFIGRLGGTLQFTVTKTYASGAANPTPLAAGFNYIDFATEGGTNNTNTLIDQLEIQLSGNYDYFAIDNFTWTANTSPTITTSGTLTNFTTCAGTVSSEKSFTASGSSLTGNITVTAPTGYELSTVSGGTFSGTLTLTQSGGNVANTTIYVRTTSGATGNPGGNITLTSASATGVAVAVTSTINALPAITTQPSNSSICIAANTTFSATATGVTSYVWQVNTGSGFTSITNGGVYTGATTATLSITGATAGMNGYQYRLVASGTCSPSAISNNVTLTVNTAPAVTSQPSTSSICAGANTIFSVAASSATGYQWQQNAGAGFSNITNGGVFSGATTSTLTITGATAGMNGYQYRAISTGSCTPNATSNAATLTVNSAPAITSQPSVSTICAGANTTFSVAATNVTGYQWQVDQGAGYANVTNGGVYSGATTATLTITGATAGLNGYVYRAVATGSCTPNATSNGASLTINSAPAITSQPSSATVNAGANTSFSVAASNATGYQWQVDQGAGYANISNGGAYSGVTTATLIITAATAGMNGYSYRVVVTGSCTPAAASNGAALTVNSNPVITGNPPNRTICPGFNTTFSITATGATSYQWQENTGSGFVNITNGGVYSNATTNILSLTGVITGMSGYIYRCVVTNASGSTNSNASTLTVPNIVVSTTSQTNVSCNGGTNGSATISATGGIAPYTYSWAPSGGTGATASGLAAGTYTVTVTDANTCQATQSFTITEPSPFSITTSQTDILCNGAATGSASVTVTGGTGAYTYSWSPSGGTAATATGLTAGTYTVTVKDANLCQTTRTFTIAQPTALVATPTSMTNIACRGGATGSATVSATGGTGTYTYSWAPTGGTAATATGLTAGTYTVTIKDANLCQTTQGFTITQPAAILSASTASTGVSCFGGSNGSASVTVSGGTPGYTYVWAPLGGTGASISGRPAGNYTCTITDANGCTLVKNITISTPAAFSVSTSKTDVSCNGGTNGSAAVTPSGATAPYSYSWSPSGGTGASATGLAAGNYTVTITDANTCQTTANITINQPSALSVTPSNTNVLCNGGATGTATVAVTGGTPGYTYVWSPSGGTAVTATGLTSGNYSVLITDANGCTFTQNFSITQPSALAASTAQINATCTVPGQASVTPSGGTSPYSYLWSNEVTSQLATGLTAGNYSVLITDSNGCTLTKNFVITTTNTLVATTSQTDVLCKDAATGTATVVPSGAPGPFTYAWAPSGGTAATATGLTAGNYSVTITSSNGCSIVKNFTITQPATALVATAGTTNNTSCNGGFNGSATVNVTGGTGAYTYSWSPSGGTAATATGLAAGTYTVTVKDANLCQTTQSFTITQPTAITSTVGAQTNVSCNGGTNGSATVTPTGGTGAYTYVWSPSGGTAANASGLGAGTYTVTIKDANLCQATQTVIITQPAVLAATTAKTDVNCFGGTTGTATVTATGGTAPYTYAWSPTGGTAATATGRTAGTYTVTVTDSKGCTATATAIIAQPAAALSATTTKTDVNCFGGTTGTATVTAAGGTAPYTYAWSPSGGTAATATGLVAGTFTVTVTDSKGCTTTATAIIAQPAAALSAITAKTDVNCFNGSNGTATVTATGGTAPYTYAWSPSGGTAATATGLAAGTFTVTVTDSKGCTATATAIIAQPTAALAATTTKVNVSCFSGTTGSATVTATGGTAPYTYAWLPSGGTAATATGLTAGTYTVIVTDSKGCTTTSSATITQPGTAITATAGSQTNLICNGTAIGSATVIAAGGTAPYTYTWSPAGGTAATATGLTGGTYTATVTDANGCSATQSFTITGPTAITATSVQTNILCNGGTNGSATLTASGGSGAGYTYSWSPSGGTAATATGLTAGVYTVTITDGTGCTGIKVVTITQPDVLVANSTTTNINCFGTATGSATVTPVGGTAPFIYVWTPAVSTTSVATGLAVGNYSVAITDVNGCTASKSFVITQKSALVLTPSHTNISCNGQADGSASVVVSGGSPEYFYQWSPGGSTASSITGLSAGTYTVVVTDNAGCSATQSFTITMPNILAVEVNQTNILCSGKASGEIALTVTGGTGPFTYNWTPNVSTGATANNLTAGNYAVAITDARGCSINRTFTITQPAVPLVNVVTKTDALCYGALGSASVATTGGLAPYTYEWLPTGGTDASANLAAGNYTVTISDANGCTVVENITITQPLFMNITTQPQTVSISTSDSATFTTVAGNVTSYQWQVSQDGTNWSNVTDGGTSPVYSGATTNSLTVSNVPVSYDGYLYRMQFSQNANCAVLSNVATLNVNNALQAVADNFSATVIYEGTGGNAGDVTANDLYNNQPLNDANVVISVVNTGGLAGVTIDENGNINVPASTPTGTYIVIYSICDVLNGDNCSTSNVTIVVLPEVVGLDDFSKANITIYPNPASTEVFVKIPDFSSYNNIKASLYDLNGRLVKENRIINDNFSMDVTGLESAIYILNVTSDSGVITKRIAVTKKF